MDNMSGVCIRRGGRADAGHFPRIVVAPAAHGRPYSKLKKRLAYHHLDTTLQFSIEDRALIRLRIAQTGQLADVNLADDTFHPIYRLVLK